MNSNKKRPQQYGGKKERLRAGIRGKLVLGFTLFVIIVLIIVWIFQVLLLDFFYEKTKIAELRAVYNGIDKGIDGGDLDEVCSALASQYEVCIVVYNVEAGELIDTVITKEVLPACLIHYADKSYLQTLYMQALESGGTITQPFNFTPKDEADKYFIDEHKGGPSREEKRKFFKNSNDLIIAVSVKAFSDSAGNEYAAFINLEFTPVNTVQSTRNTQFAYIAVVVVASSIIFALIFSSRIARPLEKMTVSAEKMAGGNYSVEFSAEGYRETQRLANTLNYAVGEISKTDKLQRELIANVSHDLRTPLTLISGYAEMMRDIPGENTSENSQLIVDETQRLTALVNDILDFSKYSSGIEQPALQVFDLTASVRKSIGRYSELVKNKGYKIIFQAESNVYVRADERMILQVLYNLINNAINYTGEDKTVRIEQTMIGDQTVRISISDSGKGISKEEIAQIWDRYYKVDKSHMRAISGSGLGLSIVSKLLQIHSSSYGVETGGSKGTTFWFALKVEKE